LPRALAEFDYVAVFDNTDIENRQQPALILETLNGRMLTLASQVPEWVANALRGTAYELTEQLIAQVRTKSQSGSGL
jgi:hypothetical protein